MKQIFVDEMPKDAINNEFKTSLSREKNLEISFLFRSDFKNTKYLRDYMLIILDILWLDTIRKNRFVLIVDELNNNAIEYWSKNWSLNIMRFWFKKENNEILLNIEVEDAWDGEKTKKASDMECLRLEKLEKWFWNHKSIRWRWLFMIITNLVDELYFRDSTKWWLIVWVNKKLILKND